MNISPNAAQSPQSGYWPVPMTPPGAYVASAQPGQRTWTAPAGRSGPENPRATAGARARMCAGVAGLGLLVGTGWALLAAPAHAAPTNPVAAVWLEGTSTPGANPFMNAVGTDRPAMAAVTTGGPVAGSTDGLYAQGGDTPSCDAGALVANLQADPARAGAWARALGLSPVAIPALAKTLTPVLLRADTAVTEHGFADGQEVSYAAVLQAGTAVMVNSYGEPTVKCFSGDPLTKAPDVSEARPVGVPWTGYTPATIVRVEPTRTVVKHRVVVDVDRNQPVALVVAPDPKPHPGPDPDHPAEHRAADPHVADPHVTDAEGEADGAEAGVPVQVAVPGVRDHAAAVLAPDATRDVRNATEGAPGQVRANAEADPAKPDQNRRADGGERAPGDGDHQALRDGMPARPAEPTPRTVADVQHEPRDGDVVRRHTDGVRTTRALTDQAADPADAKHTDTVDTATGEGGDAARTTRHNGADD